MGARPWSGGPSMQNSHTPSPDAYRCLFGESGAALSEPEWIAAMNAALPPQLSALNARFESGSRAARTLRVSFRPGPERFTAFTILSGGSTAEMLDQTAAHCGTLVTGHGLPTLTMTVNYLRAGTGSLFVVTAEVLSVTSTSAVLGAELVDEQGRPVASASVVAQLRNITGYR
ncbi:PaaI family thioesterase [Mycobacterium paraintracellulare]|uniref:PaaI family thioesterase n=1 Tax=Mycobacterium paraintracellulare TaxID=1138383 RepID=UPI001F2B35DB|nr:PaaI family thioesterase [Mycobacterium paraintracellulare]